MVLAACNFARKVRWGTNSSDSLQQVYFGPTSKLGSNFDSVVKVHHWQLREAYRISPGCPFLPSFTLQVRACTTTSTVDPLTPHPIRIDQRWRHRASLATPTIPRTRNQPLALPTSATPALYVTRLVQGKTKFCAFYGERHSNLHGRGELLSPLPQMDSAVGEEKRESSELVDATLTERLG